MLVAKRVSDSAEVVASEVDRGPEFRCPDPVCNQVVFIRKGLKRIHHFAHQPDASCAYGVAKLLHISKQN
jgi:competence CoiA-like predicted nuclease